MPVLCPSAASGGPGAAVRARPADLPGLLRHQAPGPDCLSRRLHLARERPRATRAAVVVRQQQRDLGLLVQFVRDFSERQSQLFMLVSTFLRALRAA